MIGAVDRLERTGARVLALRGLLRVPGALPAPALEAVDPGSLLAALLDLAIGQPTGGDTEAQDRSPADAGLRVGAADAGPRPSFRGGGPAASRPSSGRASGAGPVTSAADRGGTRTSGGGAVAPATAAGGPVLPGTPDRPVWVGRRAQAGAGLGSLGQPVDAADRPDRPPAQPGSGRRPASPGAIAGTEPAAAATGVNGGGQVRSEADLRRSGGWPGPRDPARLRLAADTTQLAAALQAQVDRDGRSLDSGIGETLAQTLPRLGPEPRPAPDARRTADALMDQLGTELEFEFLRRYGRSGGGR